MRKYIIILLITGSYLFLSGCTSDQPYYNIPMIGPDGKAQITGISKATAKNPTIADTKFTVYVQFATAALGDTMVAELVTTNKETGRREAVPNSKKSITVDSSLKAEVTYTLEEAQLKDPGDFVIVTFAGKTDSAYIIITLEDA